MEQLHDPRADDARGFSLLEVMVAAVISVIAIVGLAYSFSAGRGLVDRYATARDALQAAEQRLETLAMQALKNPAHADLSPGVHGPLARTLNQNQTGTEQWAVTWLDDPVDNTPGDPDPSDYRRVTVTVVWSQAGIADSVQLARSFLGP